MNDRIPSKSYGTRRTKARDTALAILRKTDRPVDASELLKLLAQHNVVVNKTTVFRMIDEFLACGLVTRHEFGEGKYRFEYADSTHHHHIVCTSCKTVQELPDCTLDHVPVYGALPRDFTITHHTLEFFGLCHHCQSSRKSV